VIKAALREDKASRLYCPLVLINFHLIRETLPHNTGWNPGSYRIWWQIFRNHTPSRNNRSSSYDYAGEYYCTIAQPNVTPNHRFVTFMRTWQPAASNMRCKANGITNSRKVMVVPTNNCDSIRQKAKVTNFTVSFDMNLLANIDRVTNLDARRRPNSSSRTNM
jgi:hypothetical protein